MSTMAMPDAPVVPWRLPHLVACFAMMRGALLGSVLATGLAAAAGYAIGGADVMASALLGALGALVFFATGMPVQLLAMGQQLQSGIGLVLVCYVSRVAMLGMVLVWLNGGGSGGFQPQAGPLALAVVATTAAWVAGLLVSHAHARIPVYDARPDARESDGV